MRMTYQPGPALAAAALTMCGLLGWPAVAQAQLGGLLGPPPASTTSAVQGNAAAVRATVLGSTSALSDTGTLNSVNDARDASQTAGSVPSLLQAEALHAVTMSWLDQVDSEASLASLGMTIGGVAITADSVLARASSVAGTVGSGSATISGLLVNGMPIDVSGAPNQIIAIPGGQIVINEQTVSPASTTVNALHVIVSGVADVVIASATSDIS
jgi:hypothetical protein